MDFVYNAAAQLVAIVNEKQRDEVRRKFGENAIVMENGFSKQEREYLTGHYEKPEKKSHSIMNSPWRQETNFNNADQKKRITTRKPANKEEGTKKLEEYAAPPNQTVSKDEPFICISYRLSGRINEINCNPSWFFVNTDKYGGPESTLTVYRCKCGENKNPCAEIHKSDLKGRDSMISWLRLCTDR